MNKNAITRALAILEGPESIQVPGARHVAIVTQRGHYPKIVLSFDGGRGAAVAMGARHYPAGTWEAESKILGFPLPRPEILSEIFETQQGELAI